MISLLKLTENDKRLITALFIILILLLVLIGYIVVVIKKNMAKQGKAIDTYMYDLVDTKLVNTSRMFKKIAMKKNNLLFFKQARKPLLIFLIAFSLVFTYMIISKNYNFNVLFSQKQGFGSLFYTFDWSSVPKTKILGIKTFIPEEWPKITHRPQFLYSSFSAWISYITFPAFAFSIVCYIVAVQAYIARFFRIRKMSTEVYIKNLDNLARGNVAS